MKKVIDKIWKYCLVGLTLFVLGVFVGHQIGSQNKEESLQSGVYKAMASSPYIYNFATMFNATMSDATMFNATMFNATSSNATNSNYVQTYNLLILNNFVLLDHEAKVGEKINLTLETSGACLTGATVFIKSNDGDLRFSVPVKYTSGFPQIEIPSNIPKGHYHVEKILAFGENNDKSTFSVTFRGEYVTKETFYVENDESNITLEKIAFKESQGSIGEKVGLEINTSATAKSIKLFFTGSDGATMDLSVKSIENDSYILIPSKVTKGTYKLNKVLITAEDGIKEYSTTSTDLSKKLEEISIEIIENTKPTYVYTNNSLSEKDEKDDTSLLNEIYAAPEDTEIIIDAESNSLINESVFNTVKGTNKKIVISYEDSQIVFNGKDIKSPKSIDASIKVKSASEDSNIKKIVNKGIVVSFSNNGDLPGKANIRIRANELLNNVLGNNTIYLYLYNEDENKFAEIDSKVVKSADGYYEFTIDHNSDYLLVPSKLDSKYITESGNVVSFQRGDRTNLVLIICGIVLVIGVAVTIFIINKKTTPAFEPFVEEKPVKEEKEHKEKKEEKESKKE